MKTTKFWVLGYFIAIFMTLFLFPMTSRVLGLAFIFSLIINTPARFVSRKIPKGALKIITGIALLTFMVFLIYSAIPITVRGVSSLSTELGSLFNDGAFDKWLEKLPPFVSEITVDIVESASQWLSDAAITIGQYVASNITSWITGVVLLIIAGFVIARRTGLIQKVAPILFPGCDQNKVGSFFDSLYKDFQTYIGGQLIIALFVGTIIGIGSAIIGVPNAIFLGLLAGITNFIPYLGVVLTSIPMIVLSFVSKGFWGVVGAIVLLVFANQIEIWFLSPKILSNIVKINWFIVLVSIIGFGELLGVFGVVFAVPILIFVKRFWMDFVLKERGENNWESTIETGTKKVKEENPQLQEENQTNSQKD
ncbi:MULTISPECIES: AI-2E family transporter [unclassified Mesotoga]|jgi:predicted PurR-regulated permease PerM|uniref:AI-2E family transporter n=1 Tax=unclassified Mesotoga TaxID=1184398 RepID=UPI000CCBF330|nr:MULTISPECIES: AI-2E family transporter [unclassified Mesotoga]MDD3460783.1 AI-2E family transporter [Mesotoga sp.]PNS42494.1 permease [Mesotoga sp. B105.6.4]HNS34759.1 AI-2E family transporter [Mesotoga sp.]HNU22832.1 AI-2E family transporter [Mesotoga sp.]